MHLFGLPAHLDALAHLAAAHGLHLVEDAAQTHGARVSGRAVGDVGTGCFSFYATRNLAADEGGMVTTDDDHLADRLRVLRNQGMRALRMRDRQPQLAHDRPRRRRRRAPAAGPLRRPAHPAA